MFRRLLIAGSAVVLVTACGSGGGASDDVEDPELPETQVAVVVDLGDDSAEQDVELNCDTADGVQAEVCSDLVAAAPELFEPVAADQACTMIYGGPERIEVTGTIEGQEIDAEFTRENGCEIDRYEELMGILEPLDLVLVGDQLGL